VTAKRTFDVVISATALVLLSPVFAVVAAAVRLTLGSPVLFRQQRPGLHARPFTLIKFRSMRDSRGPDGRLLDDAARLTAFGRLLRRTSLDELPELINVLRGDMSLVGPRPLLMEYLPLYLPHQARRHDVRPGITGIAQICGRNQLSWEERFDLDTWYVDHRDFLLDLRIIARTLARVVSGDGVVQHGQATAAKFRGYGASPGDRA
jgi:lipopolysaccharide/colanic/teichoic acid biosynthesis glycosyltransferase